MAKFFASKRGTLLGPGKGLAQQMQRRAGFQVSGARNSAKNQIKQLLAKIQAGLNKAVPELVKRQQAAFSDGGHQGHGGRPWAPLAESTLKRKAAQGGPVDILVDVAKYGGGALRDSIEADKDATKAKRTNKGVAYAIRIIARVPVGRFHATGFRNARTGSKVVPRPPVEYTEQDVEFVAQVMRNATAQAKSKSKRGRR